MTCEAHKKNSNTARLAAKPLVSPINASRAIATLFATNKKVQLPFLTAKLHCLQTRQQSFILVLQLAHLVSNDITATHKAARVGEGSQQTNQRRMDSYTQIEGRLELAYLSQIDIALLD